MSDIEGERRYAVEPPSPEGVTGWLRAGVRTVRSKVLGLLDASAAKARRRAHEEAFFRLMEENQSRVARERSARESGGKRSSPGSIEADIAFVKGKPLPTAGVSPTAGVRPLRVHVPPPKPPKAIPTAPYVPHKMLPAYPPPVSEMEPLVLPPPSAPLEEEDAGAPPETGPPDAASPGRPRVKRVDRRRGSERRLSSFGQQLALAAQLFKQAAFAIVGAFVPAARYFAVLWHKFWWGALGLPGPVRGLLRPVGAAALTVWEYVREWFEPRGEILRAAVPFQADLDEIIEEPPPPAMRGIYYFMVALLLLLLLITSLFEVEMIITGAGQISADAPPVVLQPMERAIVREIKVKVGDAVKKGQLLARLDPTFVEADVDALTVQLAAVQAEVRRVEVEINGKPYEITAAASNSEELQAAIYAQRRAQYASRVLAYDEELKRLDTTLKSTEEERSFLAQQLGIANEVEGMRTQLWQQRLTSKLQYLDSQNNRLRSERDFQSATERISEIRHSLQGKRAERQAFIDDWRRQLAEDLVQKRAELSKISESLTKASRMHDLVSLVAPEDGIVLDVAKRSVGSVVREAEPMITLVPSSATLIAEIVISSKDIGYAAPGDDVVVKVDAFPYQRHGMLKGRLMSVSEDSYNPGVARGPDSPSGPALTGAFHKARVALIDTKLMDMPPNARVFPGMTVSVEIQVGRRSVISYFLNPITRGLRESLREP